MWEFLAQLWSPLYFNVQLDLTNACNLRCKHCYHPHHRNTGALKTSEWFEVIRRIEKFSKRTRMLPKLILCGGEPLLHPDLKEIIEYWNRIFPNGSRAILTNGTLLQKPMPKVEAGKREKHPSYAEWLHENRFSFQVSIDGPNAETHDSIRGKGNFDKTLSGVRHLVSLGADFNVLSVLTVSSSQKIDEFFKLAKAESFGRMDFERVIIQGEALSLERSQNRTLRLHGKSLKSALEKILTESRKSGVKTSTQGPLWAAINTELGSADTLGFYDWIVTYKGELKVSSRTDLIIGHALNDDPYKVFVNSTLLQNLRRGRIEGCSSCSLFKSRKCSGNRNAAYAATGSFLSADPDCWLIPQEPPKNENKTHETPDSKQWNSDHCDERVVAHA